MIQKDTRAPVLTAVLFATARRGGDLEGCQQMGRRVWCIYTVEYYSATERDANGSLLEMWTDLESV